MTPDTCQHVWQVCLSYKCADLNKLVPDLMGVSTAVLESVIFVHQVGSRTSPTSHMRKLFSL